MNAADHKRMTPLLAVAALALLAVLALLLGGLGRGVRWDPRDASAGVLPPPAPAAHRETEPLQRFADVWQRPLFNADRRPGPEAEGGEASVSLGDLELTGIIVTPDLRMALMRDREGHELRVREGEALPDGSWTLQSLAPRSAVFTGNGQRTELVLKVAAHIDAGDKGGAAATPPAGSGRAEMREVGAQRGGAGTAAGKPPAHALRMRPAGQGAAQSQDEAAGERIKQERIRALKARIEARRRQQQQQARQHGER